MSSTMMGKSKKTRVRKHLNYALGWLQETAPEVIDGEEIKGSERQCLVLLDLPPGLTDAQKRSRTSIEAAVKRAVYDQKLKEFGNKKLMVISFYEPFEVPFEEVTETKLVPPRNPEYEYIPLVDLIEGK